MSPIDLSDWLFVQSHGKTYLGCARATAWLRYGDNTPFDEAFRDAASVVFDPVYEVSTALINTPQGPAQVNIVKPPFGLASCTSLIIPGGSPRKAVRDLSKADQEAVRGLIEDHQHSARAAASNIVVAGRG